MSSELVFLCEIGDVPLDSVIQVETEQFLLAVYNLEGEIFVTDDECTHGPGLLSDVTIHDDRIECDFHNGEFCIRTGEAVTAPCIVPVKTYAPIIEANKVYIQDQPVAESAG